MRTSRDNDSLGARMKDYESISATVLPRRSWTILRLDGKAFHGWTRGLDRPYSEVLAVAMDETAKRLCEQISGTVMAYVQFDEISLILGPGGTLSQPWFGGKVQKMVSVAASMATATFPSCFPDRGAGHLAHRGNPMFDARIFTVPNAAEAANYLIWRQQDAVRNSVSMAAQSLFSHKQLQDKSAPQMQQMMQDEHKVFWVGYPERFKRGGQVRKYSGMREVTYLDKRTQQINTIEAHRSWWGISPAGHYTHESLVDFLLEESQTRSMADA